MSVAATVGLGLAVESTLAFLSAAPYISSSLLLLSPVVMAGMNPVVHESPLAGSAPNTKEEAAAADTKLW